MTTTTMTTIGIDLHQRTSTLCVLTPDGRRTFTRIRGPWRAVVDFVASIKGQKQAVFEASCGVGPVFDALSGVCARVVAAHAGKTRLIFRARKKTDRIDAEKLARLLQLDEVPEAWVPSELVRSWRALIEQRRRTVDRRTAHKNGLRTLLRSVGVDVPAGATLWTKAGRAWLASVELPEAEALRRSCLLAELEACEAQVRLLTAELDRIGAEQSRRGAGVRLLQTIPGVGPRTAEAVMAYVDDPHRFHSVRAVGCYFGLTPSLDESAGTTRRGRITKQGPGTVRKMLVEAAWQCVRKDARMREIFERLEARSGRRRALVAVAHKLSRVMLSMLRSGEEYRQAEVACQDG